MEKIKISWQNEILNEKSYSQKCIDFSDGTVTIDAGAVTNQIFRAFHDRKKMTRISNESVSKWTSVTDSNNKITTIEEPADAFWHVVSFVCEAMQLGPDEETLYGIHLDKIDILALFAPMIIPSVVVFDTSRYHSLEDKRCKVKVINSEAKDMTLTEYKSVHEGLIEAIRLDPTISGDLKSLMAPKAFWPLDIACDGKVPFEPEASSIYVPCRERHYNKNYYQVDLDEHFNNVLTNLLVSRKKN